MKGTDHTICFLVDSATLDRAAMVDLVRDNVISQLHGRLAGHGSLHAFQIESINFRVKDSSCRKF